MKRIVTIFFSLLASLSLAFAYNAEMVVKSNNGRFLLKIDGRTFNRTPQSQVVIPDLQAGNHQIAMRMVDGRQNTLQFDRVYLPQNERVIFTLVRRGRDMMTLQKTASEPIRQYTPSTRPRQAGPRGNGNGYGHNKGQGQYQNADYCVSPMHQGDFQQALKAVYNSRGGSENQFRTAKQIVRTTCLSSRQLSKLLKAMNYEDHVLQVAKLGWERVVDPENFHIVEQRISRRAHLRSLQDYMEHHPRFEPQYTQPAPCCDAWDGNSCSHHDNGGYYQEEQHYDDGHNDDQYHEPLRVVSDQQFRLLVRDIRQSSYDKDKLQVGKRIVEQNPLSSEQVRQMLSLLAYDAYRLKLAKHAYRYVADPENFHIVKSAFSYQDYRRSLEEFIR